MLPLCSPPAPLPLLLHHFDSFAPSGRGNTQTQTQAKESVHNENKRQMSDGCYTTMMCSIQMCIKKTTQNRVWEQKGNHFLQGTHIFHFLTLAYRGTLESSINQCFWSVDGNQETAHAQIEKKDNHYLNVLNITWSPQLKMPTIPPTNALSDYQD